MTDLLEVLTVERIDSDLFRGHPVPTRLGRTFGGQVAGQAMMAATRTVAAGHTVHSLHGYFLRPGRPDDPTVFLVDRVRTGRSFTTRHVRAVQEGETIFSMSASFHAGDEGPTHQESAPHVPRPEDLSAEASLGGFFADEWPLWEAVAVPEPPGERRTGRPRQLMWVRYRHRLPDDPAVHVGALTYLSDMNLLGTAASLHADVPVQWASLDHALWFLRPFRADEWLLYDQISPSAGDGRTFNRGQITDLTGSLVATVVQEGLMRTLRPPSPSP
ncbi:acyl-CoA thioesterase [Geodermatophilus nigrescens]